MSVATSSSVPGSAMPKVSRSVGVHDVTRPSAPGVAIVVVNYNGGSHIEACLRSVLSEGRPNTEIVVVDNGSSDGSDDLIASRLPQVRLIRNGRNGGFGQGCNMAAASVSSEYLVFLNPDTRVREGWIDALVGALEQHPQVGLATSRVLLTAHPERLNAAGNNLHFTGLSLCRGVGKARDTFDRQEEVGLISGAAFAMRRRLFEEFAGFDEEFFLYVEDTDLSVRARLAGYTCWYVPESEVLHDYELRLGPDKTFYLERNRYRLLLKVFRWRTLAALTPALALAELLTWGYAVMSGRRRAAEKLRAYGWVVQNWTSILAARRQTQSQRVVPDATLLAACTAELDFEQVGASPASAIATAVCNPILRGLYAAVRAVVTW